MPKVPNCCAKSSNDHDSSEIVQIVQLSSGFLVCWEEYKRTIRFAQIVFETLSDARYCLTNKLIAVITATTNLDCCKKSSHFANIETIYHPEYVIRWGNYRDVLTFISIAVIAPYYLSSLCNSTQINDQSELVKTFLTNPWWEYPQPEIALLVWM